jgi:hypothetical protein
MIYFTTMPTPRIREPSILSMQDELDTWLVGTALATYRDGFRHEYMRALEAAGEPVTDSHHRQLARLNALIDQLRPLPTIVPDDEPDPSSLPQ